MNVDIIVKVKDVRGFSLQDIIHTLIKIYRKL